MFTRSLTVFYFGLFLFSCEVFSMKMGDCINFINQGDSGIPAKYFKINKQGIGVPTNLLRTTRNTSFKQGSLHSGLGRHSAEEFNFHPRSQVVFYRQGNGELSEIIYETKNPKNPKDNSSRLIGVGFQNMNGYCVPRRASKRSIHYTRDGKIKVRGNELIYDTKLCKEIDDFMKTYHGSSTLCSSQAKNNISRIFERYKGQYSSNAFEEFIDKVKMKDYVENKKGKGEDVKRNESPLLIADRILQDCYRRGLNTFFRYMDVQSNNGKPDVGHETIQ
ncbi:MAG: hypothetical protein OXB88_03330 [Bacteriovoracales bacterium]|nr:hypothetical protein [Bacteriovoracales bacterium]